MANQSHPPTGKTERIKRARSIRVRLIVLAIFAMAPLLLDLIWDIARDRVERIEAASDQALNLARQGMAAQNEAIISTRAILEVAASAQTMLAADGHGRCGRFLADIVAQVSWLKVISMADPAGRIVCSSDAAAIGESVAHSPHFVRAVQTEEFTLGDYFVGARLGPTLVAAFPHRSPGGPVDVVVMGALELTWFDRVTQSLANPAGSVALMLDGSGTLLARPPSRENWAGQQFKDHPLIRAMLAQREGRFTGKGLDGVRRIFGFAQLPGTDARLAVGLDESEILGRADREILVAVTELMLLVAIVLLGIWSGGERLFVEPIRSLTLTVQRFGRGDFKAHAPGTRWAAELIPLATGLDDMAGQLAGRERELRDLAATDGLTGMPNRRSFNARLDADWHFAAGLKQPIAILMIDIDFFKPYNDHYGHVQGDACLRKVAELLVTGTRIRGKPTMPESGTAVPSSPEKFSRRDTDFAARYGGEEFAVLLQGADLDIAMKVADRLRRAVEDSHIVHVKAPRGYVTVSIGAASVVPAEGESSQRLTEAADAGLYEAKRSGRNTAAASSTAMLPAALTGH
jgi:GGDEF domain-containing protein